MAQWHCRTRNLVRINQELRDSTRGNKQKVAMLKQMGFDGLLHLKITALASKPVLWLCDRMDCQNRQLPLANGESLQLTEADVTRIYKLPTGAQMNFKRIKKNPKLRDTIKNLGEELGIPVGIKYTVPASVILEKLINHSTADPVKFAKLYVLYAMGTLLAPTGEDKVDLRYAPFLEPVTITKSYNWAGHVLDKLIEGVAEYQAKKLTRRRGDMHFLVLNYFDHIDGQGALEPAPSCSRWTSMMSQNFDDMVNKVDGTVPMIKEVKDSLRKKLKKV